MAYLKGPRAWREVGATLWLMLLGAGLLATSPRERPSPNNPYYGYLWTGGKVVTLSDAEPRRTFSVSVLARKGVVGSIPAFATLSLSAGLESMGSNPTDSTGGQAGAAGQAGAGGQADAGGQAGAAGQAEAAPSFDGVVSPWLTLTVRDAAGTPVLQGMPFLTTWFDATQLPVSGDCEAPDPAGTDPCRFSFTVEVNRSPTGTAAESNVRWSATLSAVGQEPLAWTGKLEPL